MMQGRKFHIEADIEVYGSYLIGINDKGQTQTVEDILNSLSSSIKFGSVVSDEIRRGNENE